MTGDIKSWYIQKYPNDAEGQTLKDGVSFGDLFQALDNYEDIYDLLFIEEGGDSLIRERIFEALAFIIDTPYDYIYEQWLKGNKKS